MNNKLSTTTSVAQTLAVIALMSFAATSVSAQALPDYGVESVPNKDKEYSPYLDRGYPQKILWGDTHLHTGWSTDAGFTGPQMVGRGHCFARGERGGLQSRYTYQACKAPGLVGGCRPCREPRVSTHGARGGGAQKLRDILLAESVLGYLMEINTLQRRKL